MGRGEVGVTLQIFSIAWIPQPSASRMQFWSGLGSLPRSERRQRIAGDPMPANIGNARLRTWACLLSSR
jgi:hypothetical protein